MDHYNVDMAISVGYRVNSKKSTQFCCRATPSINSSLN
ncbi:hypothetical protein DC094_17375 [Pelagibaculum spongiae]|uniref:Uncharacterized protein n=1 Tax=Pelagibaculum spongiae TaxID=2080658 RepID=A0A2V1GS21_9GAMM|nr:hypothetical protein DC094_17375 [Pelagibaculum spongiae]